MKVLSICIVSILILASANQQTKPIGQGTITTHVDGTDVQRVNLWSSVSGNRTEVCHLLDGTKVKILENNGEYYLLEAPNGCKGYCMKGFVKNKTFFNR